MMLDKIHGNGSTCSLCSSFTEYQFWQVIVDENITQSWTKLIYMLQMYIDVTGNIAHVVFYV